jgi:uncharacterized RDD family membrane protein YckC
MIEKSNVTSLIVLMSLFFNLLILLTIELISLKISMKISGEYYESFELLIFLAVFSLYFFIDYFVLAKYYGQTFSNWILGYKKVDKSGETPSIKALIIRNLIIFVTSITGHLYKLIINPLDS